MHNQRAVGAEIIERFGAVESDYDYNAETILATWQ
jgi:hypothetical protein